MPADVVITESEIRVRFHRCAHVPIVLASGLLDRSSSRGGRPSTPPPAEVKSDPKKSS